MSDDDDLNNIIPIFKNRRSEYTEDNHDWEEMVDLVLEDHSEVLDQITIYNRSVSAAIEDLHRDVEDLKSALRFIINKLK